MKRSYGISTQRACSLISISRSVLYYKSRRRDDRLLRMRLRELAAIRIRYGFERLFILLRREGFKDNHKRVYRIYKEEGLNLRTKRPRRHKSSVHREEKNPARTIHDVWSMDFVSDNLMMVVVFGP
jgi:putative transposase